MVLDSHYRARADGDLDVLFRVPLFSCCDESGGVVDFEYLIYRFLRLLEIL